MIKNETLPFGRLITAMVTPFDDNDKVDYKAVEKIVNHLIATGSESLVVNGSTGESPTLEDAEKKELLKAVVALAKNRAKVIMGTGYNITKKSVQATLEAQDLGADGALVVAPYYNKPNQAGLISHFSAIAEATTLPLIVYNIPGRTGINIQSETIVELAKSYKNIHALKDSTGNVEQASDVAAAAKEDFVIYSGDDYLTLPFLSIGGSGVISVASHVVGREICQMQNSFFAGNLDEARSTHYKLMAMFKGLFQAPNPTCVKYILSRLGFCKENLRMPLIPLNSQQKEAMDKLVASYELSLVSR